MEQKQAEQLDKLVMIVKLANEKMQAAWEQAGLKTEPPAVSIGQADVVLEAADELGLSWKDIKAERDNG